MGTELNELLEVVPLFPDSVALYRHVLIPQLIVRMSLDPWIKRSFRQLSTGAATTGAAAIGEELH